jgi:hypothetical protein
MFILENPYISELLRTTIKKNGYQILANEVAREQDFFDISNLLNEQQFIENFKKKEILFSNSENSIEWIVNNLSFSDIVNYIALFKDKYLFRDKIKSMYPDYYYRKISFSEIHKTDITGIKKPFILKPTCGFLSIGVYTINNDEDWEKAVDEIQNSREKIEEHFPKEVISAESFIIEEYITGAEYAIDAYFDAEGNPVVINILKHLFASQEDVSDRLYMTSKQIMEDNLADITNFLKQIGTTLGIKMFPIHIEVRKNAHCYIPIEVNPMRFAGWCTSDAAFYAYGLNPYEYFMEQKKPDWNTILMNKSGKVFSIIILDKPKDVKSKDIANFAYEKLLSGFEKVIEFRQIDIQKYPLFGFIFTETSSTNMLELENILHNDLKEFITMA